MSRDWMSLFDGKTMAGWRNVTAQLGDVPVGWHVIDGAITRTGEGGDIVSLQQYGDFELQLEWKVQPGGNSGIIYRVDPKGTMTYRSGPEFQVLDDALHVDGRSRLTAAGSVYGLYPAPAGIVKPAEQWNSVRIIVEGAHVEHWLNGVRIVEYELWSEDWVRRVRNSKFNEWPEYGQTKRGLIALQDHGDRVSYRNIRIRELR